MCVPKSNSNDRYAITCDVIAYHLVHFVSILQINKCQSGIDFIFTRERSIYYTFMKISVPSQVFRGKTNVKVMKVITLECQLCFRNNKIREFDTLERQTMGVTMQNGWNNRISDGCVYAQIRRGLGMHLVTYSNHDTVLFLLIVPIKGRFA